MLGASASFSINGAPAAAKEVEEAEGNSLDAIIVTGRKRAGQTIGYIEPELSLDSEQVGAYGASSIQELIAELAPLLESGRGSGRPIVLVNGLRVSSFREIRRYPPEAIERVDILPEEVSLRYGYRANQRVLNFVLKPSFRAVTTELEVGLPTAGVGEMGEAEINTLRIQRKKRWNFDIEWSGQEPIVESDRNIRLGEEDPLYSTPGNILPSSQYAEVDPALSALFGSPVAVASVPSAAANATPQLSDFLAGANTPSIVANQDFRTLIGEEQAISVGASYFAEIADRIGMTLTAGLDYAEGKDFLGLPDLDLTLAPTNAFSPFATDVRYLRSLSQTALIRERDTISGELAFALTGDRGDGRWSFDGRYVRADQTVETERPPETSDVQAVLDDSASSINPFGDLSAITPIMIERSKTKSSNLDVEGTYYSPIGELPAGRISTTAKIGFRHRKSEASTNFAGQATKATLSREIADVQLNADIPLLQSHEVLGDLDLNANGLVEYFSDFDVLLSGGGGIQWNPVENFRILASYSLEETAPSISQLGDPIIITPNQRIFDFVSGDTVFASILTGANPDLAAETKKTIQVGVKVEPFDDADFTLSIDYLNVTTDTAIGDLPQETAAVRAIFPERFQTDQDGVLSFIDRRPINFEKTDNNRLRWGFSYSRSVEDPSRSGPPSSIRNERGQQRPNRQNGGASSDSRRAAPGGGFPRRRGASRPGGRIQLSLYHTWQLRDSALSAAGLPALDYLNGDAAGRFGGTPRHQLDLRMNYAHRGWGARISYVWQQGSKIDNDGGQNGALRFSDLSLVNARLFRDFSSDRGLGRAFPWLASSRLTLEAKNLFDQKIQVRDENGLAPVRFQKDEIDPLGRVVEIRFRKQFR
ncbi:MAG: hypothetical protein AAGC77_13625 [Pseudomonadota bacterium]